MTVGVTWRRHDEDSGQHLSLARHVFEAAALDQLGEGVVRRVTRGGEFDFLYEDRSLAQQGVAAAVVEVQVAIRGEPDVRQPRADCRQRLRQSDPAGPVIGINLGMRTHAGVEQDHSLGMAHDVAEARVDSGLPCPGLARGPDKVAEVDTLNPNVSHSIMIANGTRHPQALVWRALMWRAPRCQGQNGNVTSARFTMAGVLPLRDTDPREVGVYRLLGRLGEGGQGVVFLAESPAGSRVAVKVLPPTTDPQVRSRFLKEVAAAQRVARFCTAQVLDAGIFERRPFIVSEYVNGPSLIEVVQRDGPRGDSALERIAVATLTALGAVHAVGMVHRDFKPGNVLLGPDGPVVIDFGMASVPGMTTTGLSGQVAVGTPAYMAPEQLSGKRVTAAADMWAWAVSMTFAGTGKLPFAGESLTAMAFAILHGEPSVGRLPEPLGSLVRRCLSKDPAARPSARDALSELVAAGAQAMGPLPPRAAAPAVDDEPSSPLAAPLEAPGPPRGIAGPSSN